MLKFFKTIISFYPEMILRPLFCFEDTKNTGLLIFNSLKQKKLIFNFLLTVTEKKLTDSRKSAKFQPITVKTTTPLRPSKAVQQLTPTSFPGLLRQKASGTRLNCMYVICKSLFKHVKSSVKLKLKTKTNYNCSTMIAVWESDIYHPTLRRSTSI